MHRKVILAFTIFLLIVSVSCKQNNPNPTYKNVASDEKSNTKVQDEISTSAGNNKIIVENSDSDFILPESSIRKITEEEIMRLYDSTLDLARNEIYARKGYIFDNEKYRNYFEAKAWYKPTEGINEDSLSDIEKYNVNFIKFYEKIRKESSNYTENNKKQDYAAYKVNEKVLLDLNGDGKNDEIVYKILNERGYTLSINGISVEDGKFTNLADFFAVVDIDKSDKYKEILISDYGPSNDDVSTYYYFDGNKLIKMGETGGVIEYNEIKIDGSGNFSALTRGQILQTWYFDKHYKLTSDHKVIEIPTVIYKTDFDVFVKRQIKLYTEKSDTSKYFYLHEGQVVKIVGNDNKEWCLIETSTGRKGWFALEKFSKIRNEGLDASEFFAGLCYAD